MYQVIEGLLLSVREVLTHFIDIVTFLVKIGQGILEIQYVMARSASHSGSGSKLYGSPILVGLEPRDTVCWFRITRLTADLCVIY